MTRQDGQAKPTNLTKIEPKLEWWVVWRSTKDGVFRACHGYSERSAELTARALTKPGLKINGVDINYAQSAWALQAPSKHKAIVFIQREWLSNQLPPHKALE